jgi:hypothetical protein
MPIKTALCATLALVSLAYSLAYSEPIDLLRMPQNGLQPQTAVDAQGRLHLIYFKGEPRAGVLYAHRLRRNRVLQPTARQ